MVNYKENHSYNPKLYCPEMCHENVAPSLSEILCIYIQLNLIRAILNIVLLFLNPDITLGTIFMK